MEELTVRREYYGSGQIKTEHWYDENGKLHNPKGAASKMWRKNGYPWFVVWYKHGKRHNKNGFAWEHWGRDGKITRQEYWIDGVKLTEEEFKARNSLDGKTAIIDGKEYELRLKGSR